MKLTAKEIAKAVKQHLIDLALEDNLPLDMTELDVSQIEEVILEAEKEKP